MQQPLAGIRIIDLSHVLAGPYATHFLAMLGAEVIKVESLGVGDSMRLLSAQPAYRGLPPSFAGCNAAKRSLAVDLKRPEGRQIIEKLARQADVFVENFRPGKIAALGLGSERLSQLNPDIVYCSLSAWGQTGKKAPLGGYDHIIQAVTGMMLLQGASEHDAPEKVGFPVIDIAMGMMGAIAILSGLLGRRSGNHDAISLDVSMVDTALYLMGPRTLHALSGGRPERVGNAGFANSPGNNTFETAEGWLCVAANTLEQFDALCDVLKHPELASAPDYLRKRPTEPMGMLSGLATPRLTKRLSGLFRDRTAADWARDLEYAGVPAAKVNTLSEFLTGPYRDTPGISISLPSVQGDDQKHSMLSAGFRWNGVSPRVAKAAPRLGEDTDEILQELGYASEEIEHLKKRLIIG